MSDVRARLSAADLPERVLRLGFRPGDREAVLGWAAEVVDSPDALRRVAEMAAGLQGRIGGFTTADAQPSGQLLTEEPGERDRFGAEGVLPLLALLVTADDVVAFHRGRGIAADLSWRSLSDLGQQAWVHRRTYGRAGLHTYGWLELAWSGAFYWLGRLQLNLQRDGDAWVLSTHVPATGPLTPGSVDASFGWARTFFRRHFPECPTTDFHCSSWLLDPALAEVLPPDSNVVRFGQRWHHYGEPTVGDDDVLFFVFSRRGQVDLATLPRRTTLERAVADRLTAGRHWAVWSGRVPQQPAY